jgi:DNA-binding Lrp family transcriptional regulator
MIIMANYDIKDRRVLTALQGGIPISDRPFKDMAGIVGLDEDDLIERLNRFKDTGLLKRIDFRLDLDKLGIASTLVGCRIPENKLGRAKETISACRNITHNYLRKHGLNMWFTLSAVSEEKLNSLLAGLRDELEADEMISFPTRNRLKMGFSLDVD